VQLVGRVHLLAAGQQQGLVMVSDVEGQGHPHPQTLLDKGQRGTLHDNSGSAGAYISATACADLRGNLDVAGAVAGPSAQRQSADPFRKLP
jgi:hypothetical protein